MNPFLRFLFIIATILIGTFNLLEGPAASATTSSCESELSHTGLTNGEGSGQYRELAQKLIENCNWKNERRPRLGPLISLLELNRVTLNAIDQFVNCEITSEFDVLTRDHPWADQIERISEDRIKYRWQFHGGSSRRLVSISRRLDAEDVKLANLSQSNELPFEVGQFRYHIDLPNKEYKASNVIMGNRFNVSTGTLIGNVNGILKAIRMLTDKGFRVVGVEFVHTHPFETILLTRKDGTGFAFLNVLSFGTDKKRKDINIAEEIQNRLGSIPFGMSAIIGIADKDLSKMSYWPLLEKQ